MLAKAVNERRSSRSDEALVARNIVKRTEVFLFEALAKVFGGHQTNFAIGKPARGAVAESREAGVGYAYDGPWPSTKNFASTVSLWRVVIAFQRWEN